jgi:cytochrome c553
MCPQPIVKSRSIDFATTIKASPDMKLFATSFFSAVLALSAATAFAAGDAKPEAAKPAAYKPDVAKGQASFATCASCHGADGNSGTPANPKLAQQHPEYLVKQLQEFKSGKRANAIMMGFAAGLSEEDMKNIAYWVSSNKAKPGFAKDKELATLGERIYRGGIQERQIAACAGCHSPNGAGIPAQYPRLAGQHAEYVASSLTAYRDGTRKNNLQMTQNAAKLNDREIKALADYIAGLR